MSPFQQAFVSELSKLAVYDIPLTDLRKQYPSPRHQEAIDKLESGGLESVTLGQLSKGDRGLLLNDLVKVLKEKASRTPEQLGDLDYRIQKRMKELHKKINKGRPDVGGQGGSALKKLGARDRDYVPYEDRSRSSDGVGSGLMAASILASILGLAHIGDKADKAQFDINAERQAKSSQGARTGYGYVPQKQEPSFAIPKKLMDLGKPAPGATTRPSPFKKEGALREWLANR